MNTKHRIIKTLLGAVLSLLVTFGLTQKAAAQTARIAFSAPVTVHKTHQTCSQIFSMNPDGSGVTQLTSTSANSYYPSWSLGQQHILFYREGTLYVMEAIGEAYGGLTFAVEPASGSGADWSPDGSRIVFVGTAASGSGLWIVDVNAGTEAVGVPILLRAGVCYQPHWSPDGTRIAFSSYPGGSAVVTVLDLATSTEISFGGPYGYGLFGSWSPDASHIAFTGIATATTTKGNKTTTNNYYELFIANADGTGITQVTRLKILNSLTDMPSFSPDSAELAFSSNFSGTSSIYKMELGSGAVTLLRSGARTLDWAP